MKPMFIVKFLKWLKPLVAELVVHLFKSDQYFRQQLFLFKPGQSCEAFSFPVYIQCFDDEIKGGRGGSVGCIYTTSHDKKELAVDVTAINKDAADLYELFFGIISFTIYRWGFGI